MATRHVLALAVALGSLDCSRQDVTVEGPTSGRTLSTTEERALQRVAEVAFYDARARLEGLPPKLTLIVRFGADVNPETGTNGAAGYPGNVGLTLDPSRDVLAMVRAHVRATLVHELHHLARASRVPTVTLRDRVVSEGLATAFERDVTGAPVPWGEAPPDAWVDEVLRQPDAAPPESWMFLLPDGRRWVGMRVGTHLVDRAVRASGRSPGALVFASTDEILRFADVHR